jgi:hypothetical protein
MRCTEFGGTGYTDAVMRYTEFLKGYCTAYGSEHTAVPSPECYSMVFLLYIER